MSINEACTYTHASTVEEEERKAAHESLEANECLNWIQIKKTHRKKNQESLKENKEEEENGKEKELNSIRMIPLHRLRIVNKKKRNLQLRNEFYWRMEFEENNFHFTVCLYCIAIYIML